MVAFHFRHDAKTARVMINLPTAGADDHVPFGSRGDSFYSPSEKGDCAKEFYTVVKTTYAAAGELA